MDSIPSVSKTISKIHSHTRVCEMQEKRMSEAYSATWRQYALVYNRQGLRDYWGYK